MITNAVAGDEPEDRKVQEEEGIMKQNIITVTAVAALAVSVAACGSSNSPVSPTSVAASNGAAAAERPEFAVAAKPGTLTIAGIVLQNDGEFDVLQAAVARAGLVEALNGTAQYTVFAPTDVAFVTTLGVADEAAAIATVNSLPLETLTDILLFHVTEGRRSSRSVMAASSYDMLNGKTLSRAELLAAGFVTTDIAAANGIVHVIKAVLLPNS